MVTSIKNKFKMTWQAWKMFVRFSFTLSDEMHLGLEIWREKGVRQWWRNEAGMVTSIKTQRWHDALENLCKIQWWAMSLSDHQRNNWSQGRLSVHPKEALAGSAPLTCRSEVLNHKYILYTTRYTICRYFCKPTNLQNWQNGWMLQWNLYYDKIL